VTFADGSAGDYDLVVGADGINSAVRRLAVSPVPPQYADTVSWRSVIPVRPPGTEHLMIFHRRAGNTQAVEVRSHPRR